MHIPTYLKQKIGEDNALFVSPYSLYNRYRHKKRRLGVI